MARSRTPPIAFERDRFTWLAYLMLALYGYFLNILGPITPFLKQELRLSYTISSLHFTAFAVGILLVGLGGHRIIERLGRWRAWWVGALGLSAGAVLLVLGRTPAVTIAAALVMGTVGSLILAIVPSALADRHGEQRAQALSEANVVASLVSAAAPLLVGWSALSPGGWRLSLVLMACAPLAMRAVLGRAEPPVSQKPGGRVGPAASAAEGPAADASATDTSETDPAGTAAALPAIFWVYWTALVLSVAVEFCMVSWSADYLENALAAPKVEAAQAVSLFLGGMIIGRLAASRLVRRVGPQGVVMASVLLAGAGFLAFWLAASLWMGQAGLFITGLGVASLYPLVLALALGAAGPKTVQASARATLASGAAILALPLALGRLADAVGIRPAYGLVTMLLAGVFLIVLLTARVPAARRASAGH